MTYPLRLYQLPGKQKIVTSALLSTTSTSHYKVNDLASMFNSTEYLYCVVFSSNNISWIYTDNQPTTEIHFYTVLKRGYLGTGDRLLVEYDANTYCHVTAGSGGTAVQFQFYTAEELRIYESGRR